MESSCLTKKIKHKIKEKRAQAWSLDAIVAILIFFSGISILFFYAINYSDQITSTLDDLTSQGNTASELLLSNGELSILTNNKINQTLLDAFYFKDYDQKRRELGIKDNFYFTIDGLTISGNPTPFVGNIPSVNNQNSVKIERIIVYNNKPTKLELYIWR